MSVKKILIISPSWLGDLIMSQSLYKSLKKQAPDCEITLYAPKFLHPIISRMPEVSHIIENPFGHGQLRLKDRYLEGKKLQSYHFNEAIILANSIKSALVPFFAKIEKRTGFIGENRYLLLNNIRKNKEDFPRMVERYVALAYSKQEVQTKDDLQGKIDYPSLKASANTELLSKFGLNSNSKYLALGCGANYGPAKLWPTEYFAQVCDFWIEHGGSILAFGSTKDKKIVEDIKQKLKVPNTNFLDIAGQTNLTEALDILSICKCAICNDSGLMHTVAAVGIPQVTIFGSTSTNYTPPLSDKALMLESTQPCHPCFKRTCQYNTYACLKEILPTRALDYLKQFL